MNRNHMLAVPIAAALLAACGGKADPKFVEAAPSFDSMNMEITGDAAQEGLESQGVAQQELLGGESELLIGARFAAKLTNLHLLRVLNVVRKIMKSPPTEVEDNLHVWEGTGPKGNFEYKLTVTKESDKHFTWKLELRKAGEDDKDYLKYAEGDFTKGDVAGEKSGTFVVTYEDLKRKDGALTASGTLSVSFSVAGGKKNVAATWTRVIDDLAGNSKEINGTFLYRKDIASGNAGIRFIRDAQADFLDGTSRDTSLKTAAYWNRTIGGRAIAKLTITGTLGSKTYVEKECWKAGEGLVFRAVFEKTVASGDVEITARRVGDPSACPSLNEPTEAEAEAAASTPLAYPE